MKHVVAALLLSCPLWAQAAEPSHQFEVQGEFARIQELRGESPDEELAFQGYIGYQYLLNENFALGIDYLAGGGMDFDLLLGIDDGSFNYSAWELTARGTTWVSQRNALYATLRAIQYDYDVETSEGRRLWDDSGLGGGMTLGWRYQFDMGLGLGVSASYRKLGSDTELVSFGYNLSYRF